MPTIFKEVLDYGQTKKAVCDARCPSGTVFVRSVPCGAGVARPMFERMCAGLRECGERLSRRSGVPGQSTCSSSCLRPGLHPATVVCPVRQIHLRHFETRTYA